MAVTTAAAAAVAFEDDTPGSNLFKGMKFLVGQRVPTRNEICDKIMTYGGVLVSSESNADYIIADHARKDTPPGSISWTFITESVKSNYLHDIEEHRAGPIPGSICNTAYEQPKKTTRTPFSREDDQALWEWCLNARKQGMDLKGNIIFQQLEQINHRHTYQSWRNRWIKYVSVQRPLDDNSETGSQDQSYPNHGQERKAKSSKSYVSTVNQEVNQTTSQFTNSNNFDQPTSQSTKPNHYEVTNQNCFSQAETDLLCEEYSRIIKVREDHMIDAWIDWARQYPSHTAQQWRNYFSEYVKPMHEASLRSNTSEKVQEISQQHRLKATSPSLLSNKLDKRGARAISPSTKSSYNQTINNPPHLSINTVSNLEILDFNSDPMLYDEELFMQGLQDLAYQLNLEINFSPIICGREVSLMKLWQRVQSPEYGGFDRVSGNHLWPELAKEFGLDITAAQELRNCYSEILTDLENLRREFLAERIVIGSQEECLTEDQLPSTNIDESQFLTESSKSRSPGTPINYAGSDDLDFPRTPVKLHAGSKSREVERNNLQTRFNPNKRKRTGNGKPRVLEIPSTPENIINNNQDTKLLQKHSSELVIIPDSLDDIGLINQSPTNYRSKNHKLKFKPSTTQILGQGSGEISSQDLGRELYSKPRTKQGSYIKDNSNKKKEPLMSHSLMLRDKGLISLNDRESLIMLENQEIENIEDDYSSTTSEDIYCQLRNGYPYLKKCEEKISPYDNDALRQQYLQMMSGEEKRSVCEVEEENELDLFIKEQVIHSGISQDIVIEALEATSMSIGPESHIEQVMASLMENRGVPDNLPGVWTTSDDETLKKVTAIQSMQQPNNNSIAYRRLLKKHGLPNIQIRQDYWKDMEDDVEDLDRVNIREAM